MGKLLGIIFGIIFTIVVLFFAGTKIFNHVTNKDGQSRITNDAAEKNTDERYLTIINETEQIINKVYVTVGEGTEIEHAYQNNPDEKSFSIKIPEAYKEDKTFTVTLIDRYDLKYEKIVSDVAEKGRTEVKITTDDYVKQRGDWKRKIDRLFNE